MKLIVIVVSGLLLIPLGRSVFVQKGLTHLLVSSQEGIKLFKLPVVDIESNSEKVLPLEFFARASGNAKITFSRPKFLKVTYDKKRNAVIIIAPKDSTGIDTFTITIADKKNSVNGDFVVRVRRPQKTIFKYKPDKPVKQVFLAGDFNSWNSTALPMQGPLEDGSYVAEVKLSPGSYSYKFVVDGHWIADPTNPHTTPDGFGGNNSVVFVGGVKTGRWHSVSKKENDFKLKYLLGDAAPLDPKTIIVTFGNKVLSQKDFSFSDEVQELLINTPSASRPPLLQKGNTSSAGEVIRINAMDTSGNIVPEFVIYPENYPWRTDVIYFAFIDRFCNGDKTNDSPIADPDVEFAANYQGGDFQGIINKINEGYFQKLGVSVLWLSPFVKNPDRAYTDAIPPHKKFTGYHGYWPVSFWEVDSRFGTKEQLKELVALAHKNNMKVIFDMVLNHLHEDNPLYKKKPEWFSKLELPDGRKNIRLFDERPYDTWFDTFLPDIDYSNNPDAIDYMVDNCIWWIKQTNCDGFRLDAVKHMPMEFWKQLRRKIRQEIEIPQNKTFYLVGETISSRETIMEFIGYDRLDGQFDFPLYWVIKDVFAWQTQGFEHLEKERKRSEVQYGDAIMSPLLGNHDFARFTAFADGAIKPGMDEKALSWSNQPVVKKSSTYKKLKLAFTFLLTQPGIPMIYYGDEIGLCGAGDPDNRRMMKFGRQLSKNEKDVLDYVAALNKIRKESNALKYGEHHTLLVAKDIYAYLKNYFGEVVIVVLNRSTKPQVISLAIPDFITATKFIDVFNKKAMDLKKIKLQPHSAIIMKGTS